MSKAKLNSISMAVKFENFQPINNTGFVRGECKVAYAGKNRNYSNIFKEAFEKAEPTIFGIPVVGNWLGDNYGGHDIVIETKGNEISFKDATVPFGFVPQDANPRWESVEDENGNSKNYYVVDVILWQERYPEQIQFVVDNGANQSMEIMVTDGDWDEDWEYFNINDFYYSALCLLGREVDEDGKKGDSDVEPCFENSEVVVGRFSMTEKFKKDLFAIKSAFEGGENVTVEDNITETEEVVEMKEEFEEEIVEQTEDVVDEIVETKEDGEEFNEEVTEATNEEIVDFELKYNDILEQFNTLKDEFDLLNIEVEELREYKKEKETEIENAKKDELISDYALLLTDDEIEIAVNDRDSMTYDEIELSLSKAFAKKSLEEARNKKTDKKDTDIVFDNKLFEDNKKKNKFAI